MPMYARNTEVSVERTEAEIKRTLAKYGATQFMSGWDQTKAMVAFKVKDRLVRFEMDLPDRADQKFTRDGRSKYTFKALPQAACLRNWEQACRQRWRALALCIKAKLEAVETGISTFEQEFLANIVLPDNRTIGDHIVPKLDAVTAGKVKLLTMGRVPADADVIDAR